MWVGRVTMDRSDDYRRGYREAITRAVTWLHAKADEMNDPKAKALYNTAAFQMGTDFSSENGRLKRARSPDGGG